MSSWKRKENKISRAGGPAVSTGADGVFLQCAGESHMSMKLYWKAKLTACAGNIGSRKEKMAHVFYATCGIIFACVQHLLLETDFSEGLC